MNFDVIVDERYKETEIKIYANKRDNKIDQIIDTIKQIENNKDIKLNGYINRELFILSLADINRFYTEFGVVYAEVEGESFRLKEKLYEIENKIQKTSFCRISKSEIVNINMIKKVDLSIKGTICIIFKDGSNSYTSRRFVKKVKEFLLKEKGSV